MLAGDPPDSGQTAGPVTDTDPAVLGRAPTRIRDKVVIVRPAPTRPRRPRRPPPSARAPSCSPSPSEQPLPAIPAGRAAVPVIGVTGDAAEQCSKPSRAPRSASARPSARRADRRPTKLALSPNTSQGPSAGGLPKPDLAAPGSELTAGAGGGAAVAGGTAIAAAQHRRRRRQARPHAARADPRPAARRADRRRRPARLPPDRAGAGAVAPRRPARVTPTRRRRSPARWTRSASN